MLPMVGDTYQDNAACIEVYSQASLPLRFGEFLIFVLRSNVDSQEHVVLMHGAVHKTQAVPVRLHSECLTGDVFGSLRCDCRQQLEMALEHIGQAACGMLLYMRQEGRGIGLGNKIRAYALQETGLDTVEANKHLGFAEDMRDYHIAALILKMFGVASIQLLTNNPHKITALQAQGIVIDARIPIAIAANPHNAHYLATKARKSGHLLPVL